MEESAVSEPRDERARLLRVPAPVAPPRLVRPDRARHQQQGEAREGDAAGLVHQGINLLLVGQRRAQAFGAEREDDDEERRGEARDERREFYGVRAQAEEQLAAARAHELRRRSLKLRLSERRDLLGRKPLLLRKVRAELRVLPRVNVLDDAGQRLHLPHERCDGRPLRDEREFQKASAPRSRRLTLAREIPHEECDDADEKQSARDEQPADVRQVNPQRQAHPAPFARAEEYGRAVSSEGRGREDREAADGGDDGEREEARPDGHRLRLHAVLQ